MKSPVRNSASSRDVQDQGPIIIESSTDAFGDRFGKSARARRKERRLEGERRQGATCLRLRCATCLAVSPHMIGGAADAEAKSGFIKS
eukprot:4000575-Pleurochrysis_carterae.AAC.1